MNQDQQILGIRAHAGFEARQSPGNSSTNAPAFAGHRARRPFSFLLASGLIGLLTLGTSACGQKGPLYLPTPATAPTSTSPTPAK